MILDKRFSDEIVYLASLGLFNMKLFIINFDFLDFNKIKIRELEDNQCSEGNQQV